MEAAPILARLPSQAAYQALRPALARFWERDGELRARNRGRSSLDGYCALCRSLRHFALPATGQEDAFREALTCSGCGLSNRVRAALAVWLCAARPAAGDPLHLCERVTPAYDWLAPRFPALVASEYCGAEVAPGAIIEHPRLGPIRHEDLTRLSFPARSLRHALCFDVLEHLPEHRPALAEFARVLVPGGFLVLTLPFDLDRLDHEERARRRADGSLEHLLPPLFHGDPLDPESGVLCFRTFGWALLSELREAGFQEAWIDLVWSPGHGHLGWPNPVLLARR